MLSDREVPSKISSAPAVFLKGPRGLHHQPPPIPPHAPSRDERHAASGRGLHATQVLSQTPSSRRQAHPPVAVAFETIRPPGPPADSQNMWGPMDGFPDEPHEEETETPQPYQPAAATSSLTDNWPAVVEDVPTGQAAPRRR